MANAHRQLSNTVINQPQALKFGGTSVDTTPSYQIHSTLDTPQNDEGIISGSGAAAGASMTGAGSGVA